MQEIMQEIKGRKVEIEVVTGGYILTLIEGPLTPKTEREIYTDFAEVLARLTQLYLERRE